MKAKIFFFLLILCFNNSKSSAQCSGNTFLYGSLDIQNTCTASNVPLETLNPFLNAIWAGDYIEFTNVVVGSNITITASLGRCITVRTGSTSGPLVTNGTSSITFVAPATTLYILYNTDCTTCGTDSNNGTSSLTITRPNAPTTQDCEGAMQLCNNSSLSGNSNGNSCNDELDLPFTSDIYYGPCAPAASQPHIVESPLWNTNLATEISACESVYGVGNCIINGGSPYNCGGGDRAYNYQFYINASGQNNGCLGSGENQSAWYYVNINSSGTLNMNLVPNNGTDDYDFAVWGPFNASNAGANCPPISSPIRCSWDAGVNTGLSAAATDNAEGAYGGDGFVSTINTIAGDVYILLVDNFTASFSPYNITWGGTAGIGCTPVNLSVKLIDFQGQSKGNNNQLKWETNSEINNSFFTIERSVDGEKWEQISEIKGSGTTDEYHVYQVIDDEFEKKINYYRLSQTDFDGRTTTLKTVSIDNRLESKELIKIVNTLGQEISADSKGLKIFIYTDGTIVKEY